MKTFNYIISVIPFVSAILFGISIGNFFGVMFDRTSMSYNTMSVLVLVGFILLFICTLWYCLCGLICESNPYKLWTKTLDKLYNQINLFE